MDNKEVEVIESKALSLLEKYEGANNYIIKLKQKKESNKHFIPTRSQCDYIINYSNTTPKIAKKWVELDTYFAQKFSEDKLLPKVPENIWIEKLLVEKDKSYHIWGKFFSGDTNHDLWLPKTALIKTQEVKKVEIDYSKYDHRPPMEYQKVAIEKLVGTKKFILGDSMGLGKSLVSVISSLETGVKKILIICPSSLKLNWKREFEFYTDRPIYIAEGKNFSLEHDIVIVNYDILKNFYDLNDKENSLITKAGFELVIIDEAHFLQNPQANRTKIVNSFAKNVKYLWLLTGTPMTSRPMNYFNLLSLIESPVAANWMAYAIRYCEGYQFSVGKKKIWNTSGASNLDELRERTSKQFLRRLKEDVLDLPEKIITPVYLELKSKEYEELVGEYYDWYNKSEESKSLTIQFTKLMKVRQVIAIELAENIIVQEKKVIIFTNFTNTLQQIYQHFGKKAVFIDGSCSTVQRQYAVDQFQENDNVVVFVGNLKAAGAGITLTAAEACIMNDLSFVPSDHQQAEDRAYRYGQKNCVSIYYPLFHNTIEGVIYDMLINKKNIIDTVMGDNINTGDVVEEIMRRINNI